MNVWVFNSADNEDARKQIEKSVRNGKSRFGWSMKDENNLKLKDNWTEEHPRQSFLLEIEKGDWIVHVNTPDYGQCIAAMAKSSYGFDEGLQCDYGVDFRHCIEVDTDSVVAFDRNDPNILPGVNLKPRRRYHRIYAVDDFNKSLDNLGKKKVCLSEGESKEGYYLREKVIYPLVKITEIIRESHQAKKLEGLLAEVFRRIPGVVDVLENGYGWGTDYGADLIVTRHQPICNLDFEHKIVVQVKSYSGEHYCPEAVKQIETAIKNYQAQAGIIITTAQSTPDLEEKVKQVSERIGIPIDLIAGKEVAKFIIKYASDLLFP